MKLRPLSVRIFGSAVLAGSLAFVSSGVAATLSLESVVPAPTTFGTPVDLTGEGTLDWAYWSATGSFTGPVAPTNRKAGGSLIGSASPFGGGELRGSSSSSSAGRYSFADGTSPASGENRELAALLFNNQLGSASVGKGFSLEITGDPEVEYFVRLYFGGFGSVGKLTLSLNGAETVFHVNETAFDASAPKDLTIYTVRFQPDTAVDRLSITYVVDSVVGSNPNAHVGMEAVTVSTIPEPSSAILLGIGAIALGGGRRRRR